MKQKRETFSWGIISQNKIIFFGIAIFIFSLLLFVHAPFWMNPFHFDDLRQILNNETIGHGGWLPVSMIERFPYRFFPYWTLHLNAFYWGKSPLSYHFVNMLIHFLNSILIIPLVVYLMRRFDREPNRNSLHLMMGFIACFWMAVHPISSDLIYQVTLRANLFAQFFYLVALCVYIKYEKVGVLPKRFLFLLILLFLLAIDSKASAISLPLTILCYQLFLYPKQLKNKQFMIWAIVFIMFLLALFWRGIVWQQHYDGIFTYFMNQTRVILGYLFLYTFPINMAVDYDFLVLPVWGWQNMAAFFALLLMSTILFLLRRKIRLVTFLWFWLLLSLLPTSSFVPREDFFVFYRFYFAVVPFTILVCYLLSLLIKKKRVYLAACFLVMLALMYATHLRNETYANEISLWREASELSPSKVRVWNNFGQALLKEGEKKEAIEAFQEAIRLDPENPSTWSNLGLAYQVNGDFQKALERFQKAHLLNPFEPTYLNNVLQLLFKFQMKAELERLFEKNFQAKVYNLQTLLMMVQYYQAYGVFEKAEKLALFAKEKFPEYSEPQIELAKIKAEWGRNEEAEAIFQGVLESFPGDWVGLHAYGLFLKDQGRFDEAEELFLTALLLKPNYLNALNNLANLYFQTEEFDDAEKYYVEALKLNPNFKAAEYNLEQLLHRRGKKSAFLQDK